MADANYNAMMANLEQSYGTSTAQSPATSTTQSPTAAGTPKMVFQLKDGSTVDEMYAAQLAQQYLNMPVSGVDPAGINFTLQNGSTVPVAQVLGQLGAQVSGIRPLDVDYSDVRPELRSAMASLPDDFRRQQYLNHYLKASGHEGQPLTAGSDSDWFVFNDQTGKWHAATNAPGIDTSDAAAGLVQGGRFLGALGGGALGALAGAGVGSLPAGIAGAGVGQAAADAAISGIQQAINPSYRAVVQSMPIAERVGGSAMQALEGAGGAALGFGAGKVLGTAVAPLSRAAGAVGQVLRPLGETMGVVGRVGQTQLGKDLGTAITPGLSEAQLVGLVGQIPGGIVKGGVRAADALGNAGFMKSTFPGAAQSLQNFAATARGPTADAGAREILENLGRSGAKAVSNRFRGAPGTEELRPFVEQARVYNPFGNKSGPSIDRWIDQTARGLYNDSRDRAARVAGTQIGASLGRGVENASRLGKSIEGAAANTFGRASGLLGGAGRATERVGSTLERASRLGRSGYGARSSLEDQIYGQLGSEEIMSRMKRANILGDSYRDYQPARQTILTGG